MDLDQTCQHHMPQIELVEEITTLDNNKYAIGIFVDLKKAFDTVNHDILAKKLYFYGIHGVAHQWIMNYLENRSQFVQYDNCDSEVLKISCGVSQGSVLGLKLFILYILIFVMFQTFLSLFYLQMIPTCSTVIVI